MRWLTNPVVQFLATGFVTLVVVVLVTSALSRQAADEEAVADARALTQVLGRSVAQPDIPPGLVDGDAAAIDRLDRTVLDRLLVGDVRRIKVWGADGTVLYSDRTELVGARYPLGDDELDVIREGGTDAELSDLSRPENRYERALGGDLLEVYTRIRSPEGDPLPFEAYFTADELGEQRAAVLDRFLPITIGALAALVALATPLMLLLNRRLSRAARERERLLEAAVRASDAERLRIARDLHDGVVQDLAGTAFTLSAEARGDQPVAPGVVAGAARSLRRSLKALRSLLVEIHPPDLAADGLSAALEDLVAPAGAAGMEARVEVDDVDGVPDHVVTLVWRVAQEAVRNALRHSCGSRLHVIVRRYGDTVQLEVRDDGVGMDTHGPRPEGSLGLRGLSSLVHEHGGTLSVESEPGQGTTVRVEVAA